MFGFGPGYHLPVMRSSGLPTEFCYFYSMEYLWPPYQVSLHAGQPAQHDTHRHVSGKHLSILWVPVILLVAILCIPLPFPTGLPLVALAMSLLLNQSRRARVLYVRTKRRLNPKSRSYRWFDTVDRLIRLKRRRANRRCQSE